MSDPISSKLLTVGGGLSLGPVGGLAIGALTGGVGGFLMNKSKAKPASVSSAPQLSDQAVQDAGRAERLRSLTGSLGTQTGASSLMADDSVVKRKILLGG